MVIFDCDGVLVDSESITNTVLSQMLSELGFTISVDASMRLFNGGSLESVIRHVEARNISVPETFADEFRQRTFAAYRTDMRAIEGVAEVVTWVLSQGRAHCVASSGPHAKIRLNLELAGLWGYFEGRAFSSYDIGRWKPEPDIFLHAAQAMQIEPTGCVVVEDSLVGVQAGVAAGMRVLGYSPEGDRRLTDAGATLFRHMNELPELLSCEEAD